MFRRTLRLPAAGTETWGPRQTGKTTLLRQTYLEAFWIDLLKAEEYRRYLQNPERLREEVATRRAVRQVVIDEVQKVPQILDEVHWLSARVRSLTRTSPTTSRRKWPPRRSCATYRCFPSS